jgi:hypothetical protein
MNPRANPPNNLNGMLDWFNANTLDLLLQQVQHAPGHHHIVNFLMNDQNHPISNNQSVFYIELVHYPTLVYWTILPQNNNNIIEFLINGLNQKCWLISNYPNFKIVILRGATTRIVFLYFFNLPNAFNQHTAIYFLQSNRVYILTTQSQKGVDDKNRLWDQVQFMHNVVSNLWNEMEQEELIQHINNSYPSILCLNNVDSSLNNHEVNLGNYFELLVKRSRIISRIPKIT